MRSWAGAQLHLHALGCRPALGFACSALAVEGKSVGEQTGRPVGPSLCCMCAPGHRPPGEGRLARCPAAGLELDFRIPGSSTMCEATGVTGWRSGLLRTSAGPCLRTSTPGEPGYFLCRDQVEAGPDTPRRHHLVVSVFSLASVHSQPSVCLSRTQPHTQVRPLR